MSRKKVSRDPKRRPRLHSGRFPTPFTIGKSPAGRDLSRNNSPEFVKTSSEEANYFVTVVAAHYNGNTRLTAEVTAVEGPNHSELFLLHPYVDQPTDCSRSRSDA